MADLHCEPVVDLRVAGDRNLGSADRIQIDRMSRSLAYQTTAVAVQVSDQLVPFYGLAVPTSTESGMSSIRSASGAAASALGLGNGWPSSSSN